MVLKGRTHSAVSTFEILAVKLIAKFTSLFNIYNYFGYIKTLDT